MQDHERLNWKRVFEKRIDHIKMQLDVMANELMAVLMLKDELQWLEDMLENLK